jgi:pyridoxal 5'-phosphate synthase pdxS subunit
VTLYLWEKLIPKYLILEMRIMTISLIPSTHSIKGIKSSKIGSMESVKGTQLVKRGFAHMQKHGVIMDVTNAEQARIAEEAGAVAVMVLDKLPFDVRRAGGVARTASIKVIEAVLDSVSIPVMAKCRIGHNSEALVLQESGVDMIDESEVLTPADEERHIWKWDYTTPFVNGAKNLGEALRRIEEGASMIRTKGEPGTGNVAEAVAHIRSVNNDIRKIRSIYENGDLQELIRVAREFRTSYELVTETSRLGRLPVVNFAAGGISTPADAAMLMQLGCDGIFVGSGIFIAEDPLERAKAIVLSTTYFDDPKIVMEAQKMVDERKSMLGLDTKNLELKMQERGPAV